MFSGVIDEMSFKKNEWAYRVMRALFIGPFLLVFNPKIIGKENIPGEGSCVIAGNHKHALDPILVDSSTRRTVNTLAKKDLHDGPFGWFFRAIGSIPVDLHAEHNRDALEAAVDRLNGGCLVNVSPEAKRNFTEEILLPFKFGAVVMAQRTGSLIVPYAITGDYKFRSKNLKIVFGEAMDISQMSVNEANEKLFCVIKEMLIKSKAEETE